MIFENPNQSRTPNMTVRSFYSNPWSEELEQVSSTKKSPDLLVMSLSDADLELGS